MVRLKKCSVAKSPEACDSRLVPPAPLVNKPREHFLHPVVDIVAAVFLPYQDAAAAPASIYISAVEGKNATATGASAIRSVCRADGIRCVVERSFAWQARFTRLSSNFERMPEVLAGLHFLVFTILMLPKIVLLLASKRVHNTS